jgi:hypothetical protein
MIFIKEVNFSNAFNEYIEKIHQNHKGQQNKQIFIKLI